LLGKPELRRTMGEAGRTRLATCFSVEQMTDKILAVYHALLRG
jgi:glycosyltransferase involved in cell wall biosynthesis